MGVNVNDPNNEIPEPLSPIAIVTGQRAYTICRREVPAIELSCGYQLQDETKQRFIPYREKPLDRSKYMPHQGAREMQCRVQQGRTHHCDAN